MPAQLAKRRDHNDPLFHFVYLYFHLSLLIIFLAMFSIAPQIFSKQKQALALAKREISTEVMGTKTPCTSSAGGYGDVDGDGSVTSRDAQFVLQNVAGSSTPFPFTADVKTRADVDGMNGVDSADARLILRYVLGTDYTFPMCVDHDGDGFMDGVENYIVTDPYRSCGTGAWPPDLDNDGKVSNADTAKFGSAMNSKYGAANYNVRYDLNHDRRISLSDVLMLSPYFGTACKVAPAPTINMQVAPASTVTVGQTITITWTSTNTIAPCDATGGPQGWAGQKPVSNTVGYSFSSATAVSYDLTLTCYGPGGKIPTTATIKFNAPPTPTPAPTPAPTPPPPPPPPPVIGDPGKDAIMNYIKDYVGGWSVFMDFAIRDYSGVEIGRKKLNYGALLWGLAGCESSWNRLDFNPGTYKEKGLFQYQAKYILNYPDSPIDTWGGTVAEARGRGTNVGGDIWDFQHQVQVTAWKIKPGGGDWLNSWTHCWMDWAGSNGDKEGRYREWSDFIDTWPASIE